MGAEEGPAATPATSSPPAGSSLARAMSADHRTLGFIALIVLASLTCLTGLGEGPPLEDHESINALGARSALESGRWLIAVASYLTGSPDGSPPVTDFSSRLPSAIAGFATVLVVFWLGSMLYGYRAGLTAGVICAGCAASMFFSRNAHVDMILTPFTTLPLACFWRGTAGMPDPIDGLGADVMIEAHQELGNNAWQYALHAQECE